MTLTEQQRAEGWREHDGGPCPVALDSRPGVVKRSGWMLEPGIATAGGWAFGIDNWRHEGKHRGYDIIAFRPEPQA